MADIKSGQDVTALMAGIKSGDDVTSLMGADVGSSTTVQEPPRGHDFKVLGVSIHVPPDEQPRLDSNVAGWGQDGAGIAPEDLLMGGLAAKSIAKATSTGGMIAGLKEAVKNADPIVKYEVSRRALRAVGVPDGVAEILAAGVVGYRPGGKRAIEVPKPSVPDSPHLDLSQRVPAGGLTQQQIGERMAAARAQGMNAPQLEPVKNPATPVRVPLPERVVPEGPPEPSMAKPAAPSKSPQQVLNEEAIARRRAMVAPKPTEPLPSEQKMSVEDAAAELQRRWGTPSDAERRFPVNKAGLPSDAPTARKARGKVSDLADMSIEKPKAPESVVPTVDAPSATVPTGKLSSLSTPEAVAPVKVKAARVPKSKVDTPAEASKAVTQQVKHVINVDGVKSGAEVQQRVLSTLQGELQAASEASGFKTVEYRPGKAYGGREGVVVVDGEPLARVDRYGKMTWLDGESSYTTAQGQYVKGAPSKRGEIGFNNSRGEMTPTEVAKEAQTQVAAAFSRASKAGQIVIDIPGDGTFTIERNPHAIEQVIKRISDAPSGVWGGVGSVKSPAPKVGPPVPKSTW